MRLPRPLVVDRSEPFTAWLFFRKDQRRAGDALIAELQTEGKLTEKEMSGFSWRLDAGEVVLGGSKVRFSRRNFYAKILSQFQDLGFVGQFPEYVNRRKIIMVYKPILQPLPSRKPQNPSFMYVFYEICQWWNDLMFPKTSEPEREATPKSE